jgi:hypothetical protein
LRFDDRKVDRTDHLIAIYLVLAVVMEALLWRIYQMTPQ